MPFTLTIPHEYGYVVLAATSTYILALAHSINAVTYRRAAKVPYPACYASEAQVKGSTEAFQFNCAQRAHANFTENHLTAVGALLIAGLQYPTAAAVCGFGWTLSRAAYMVGYSRSNPGSAGRGRYAGSAFWLFQLGLIGMTVATGVKIISN